MRSVLIRFEIGRRERDGARKKRARPRGVRAQIVDGVQIQRVSFDLEPNHAINGCATAVHRLFIRVKSRKFAS